MLLSDLLVVLCTLGGLFALSFVFFADAYVLAIKRGEWTTTWLSVFIIVVVGLVVATRSLNFGVDTVAYVGIFQPFCERGEMPGYDSSYTGSVWLLNTAMFGACDFHWLPAAWIGLMVLLVLCGGGGITRRVCVLALLLASMIGLELGTNALRQGLSVAAMIAALSWWQHRRPVAVLLGGLAVMLHSSSALVLFSLIAASFGWSLFLLAVVVMVGGITVAVMTGATASLLAPLLYEITKYLGHEADELWVRVLAFACVAATIAAPILGVRSSEERQALYHTTEFQTALKLALCCIPPLGLPYFGYRFIYGVYPLVLWFVVGTARTNLRRLGGIFGLILAANLLILFAWSFGSSYMRTVFFYE